MLNFDLRDGVAVLSLDDGKANVLSHTMIEAVDRALERASKEAEAVVLAGREGMFCAGFDLGPMTEGPDAARALVTKGAGLFSRLLVHPQPVVIACTGHALAAGAVLLLAVDARIGARGAHKIGLNEVAIGLRLPIFAVELARARLCERHLVQATALSRIYNPDGACEAGFLDEVVEGDVVEQAVIRAGAFTKLGKDALAQTKRVLWGTMLAHLEHTLEQDLQNLDVSQVRRK